MRYGLKRRGGGALKDILAKLELFLERALSQGATRGGEGEATVASARKNAFGLAQLRAVIFARREDEVGRALPLGF
jgi:hypothetical protein